LSGEVIQKTSSIDSAISRKRSSLFRSATSARFRWVMSRRMIWMAGPPGSG